MKKTITAILLCLAISSVTGMAAGNVKKDTIRVYRLGEIIATGEKEKPNVAISTSNFVNYRLVQTADAVSLTDLGAYIPAAKVATNSRGECLVYLRGAGERHLGLFFDGAMINVPWDNRMDMSMIPTDIIGSIQVNKGSNSILYGANILSGAMNISTIERAADGIGTTARIQAGDAGSQLYSITNDGRFGIFNWLANVSYTKSDGMLLSANAPDSLRNQNMNSSLRTNTDLERLSAYARAEAKFSDNTTLGLSFNHINAEKGVAPETSQDPGSARYWRYPDWNRNIITFNGEHFFCREKEFSVKATVWEDLFKQTINNYSSATYQEILDVQKDDDKTTGARVAMQYMFLPGQRVIVALNGTMSSHDMTKISGGKEDKTEFSQNIFSAGAEYRGNFGRLNVHTGLTWDYMKTPKTGLFTDAENTSMDAIGAFLGGKYMITNNVNIFANVSKKTRFPSLRECYDAALGKFVVNPDLKPESAIISELGAAYSTENFSATLTAFGNFYNDLIAKVSFKDSTGKKLQKRVNYSEATITGAELTLGYKPVNMLDLEAIFTVMNSDGKDDGKDVKHLEYKPEFSGFFSASYAMPFGLTPRVEVELMGTQWGLNPKYGDFEELDPYALLNARIGYNLPPIAGTLTELFVRINNITDKFYYGQVGLPMSGRMFFVGLVARI